MTYRRPYLAVIGPNSEDMLKTWGSALIGVKLVDRDEGESDEATFIFTRKPPYMPIPGEGTPYIVRAGWDRTNVAIVGHYTFQRAHIFGHPKQGQQLHLICRAGDLIDILKRVDSEHYDEKNGHRTLGDVFRTLFKATGKEVVVHPDIEKLPIPGGYSLRWNQSAMDYAMQIADENTALVKPTGDKIVVLKRDNGQSGTGATLNTIEVQFDQNYEFDVELEPRFQYQKVSASYLDTDKGTLEREEKSSGQKGASDALPHPFSSKDGAKQASDAMAAEWGRFTAQGLFTKAGDPAAVSSAPVKCSGFGTPIDETKWQAVTVTHDIIPTVGWTTTIEAQAKPEN